MFIISRELTILIKTILPLTIYFYNVKGKYCISFPDDEYYPNLMPFIDIILNLNGKEININDMNSIISEAMNAGKW